MGPSPIKLPASCTICDEPCFEVLARWDEGEERAGQIKRPGPPLPDSTRITFLLFDGTRADMTFCGRCAASLTHLQYPGIWRKVVNSWKPEIGDRIPAWFSRQPGNGMLLELGRKLWTEHANG